MIFSVTGHRPDKLLNYGEKAERRLKEFAITVVKELTFRPTDKMITGMALGWDTAIAEACIELNIPFIAAVPFKGQEGKWPEQSQKKYRELLTKASEIKYVCEDGYAAWKMHKRNSWMVDNSEAVIALWNGDETGGTANCVNYAREKGKEIYNFWKDFEKFKEGIK